MEEVYHPGDHREVNKEWRCGKYNLRRLVCDVQNALLTRELRDVSRRISHGGRADDLRAASGDNEGSLLAAK